VQEALSPHLQVENSPVVRHQTRPHAHYEPSNGPPMAVFPAIMRSHGRMRYRRLDVSRRRHSNAVRVRRSKPNVTRSTTRITSSYDPQTALSSLNPCFLRKMQLGVLDVSRRRLRNAIRVKRSTTDVEAKTNTRFSFRQAQDPRVFTALEWQCSHDSGRAKPCQDGTVIRERSNAKRSKRSVAKHSKRSRANVCRTMKRLPLSTEPPTSQLGSPTRDTHLQDACLAGVPCHALIRGRSERSDARQRTRVNIKYVTKVTCHATIIKCVYTFATEFTGPVHLQGQVFIPNKVS
jgi:hypothetical protein